MSIVYELESDPRHHTFALVHEEESRALRKLFINCEPIGDRWRPVQIDEVDDEPLCGELPPGDFEFLGTIPVFSERAVEAIGDILRANGELLPLLFDKGTYWAYHVTRIIDALDVERSEVKCFSTSQKIMHIVRYAFRPEALTDDVTIFTIPEMCRSRVYVTDRFVERVQEAGLTGFDFVERWRSEES